MKSGLLWFDNAPDRSLIDKVVLAAKHYERKLGQRPNRCYVHQDALSDTITVNSVQVKPLSTVLPHHFLLTVVTEQRARGADLVILSSKEGQSR